MRTGTTPTNGNEAAIAMRHEIDGFVLRTPLLPVSTFVDLATPEDAAAAQSAEGYARVSGRIRERLRELIMQPAITEALFIASPTLTEGIPGWVADPLSKGGQKVERSLVKYVARMSSRCTPFGLFSGCSAGRLASATRLRIETSDRAERQSRLDMDYLFALTEAYNASPQLRASLRFKPNDTIVAVAGRYRYVEPRIKSGKTRSYHLVAVEQTPYLDVVLRASADGATVPAIAAALTAFDPSLEAAEVHAYLDELIASHVLVSTLQPLVTGGQPAEVIARDLRAIGVGDAADRLEVALAQLRQLDDGGPGASPQAYLAIAQTLKPLPPPVEISRLVQVDMRRPAVATLGPVVRAEIERCAAGLARFGRLTDVLGTFKTAFEKRYGTALVPLLQVLDEESGIGLGDAAPSDESPLIAGFPARRDAAEETGSWRPKHIWLLDRLQSLWAAGGSELALQDEDMTTLFGSSRDGDHVAAFGVGLTLVAPSAEAVDRGDFEYVYHGAVGPSGARILGRFCHVDPDIAAMVTSHLRGEEEQEPEAVFAELVHLPQGRVGNVILRPVLREYELPFLGRSGAAEERQIALSELLVTVRRGRVILWCDRLGKRVIPRSTNAHNFAAPGMLTPYRFLGLMQMDGLRSAFVWDWGPLANVASLPRVRWGRCILALATWRVTAEELQPLARLKGHLRYAAVRAWAEARRLPRFVELADGDNDLLVDLNNPLSVEAFIELVDNRSQIRLNEVYPSPDALCVSDGVGRFAHEIYVPVVRAAERPAVKDRNDTGAFAPPASTAVPRASAPGSEWMFVKVYAGAVELDRVLTQIVAPIVCDGVGSGAVDRWFFIRYADPDHHLRVRFRGDPRRLHGEVLILLQEALAPLLASGHLSRVQLDTYQPEIERYGGEAGLNWSEQLFQADSEAVVAVLGELEGDGGHARWQLALRGMEMLLDDFVLPPDAKRALVAKRRREFGVEFRVEGTRLRHLLGDRFRQLRKMIDALDDPRSTLSQELEPALTIWRRRSLHVRPIAEQLFAASARRELFVPVETLIESYLHMFVNRFARANGRTHELVMFDFLNRQIESREARARRSGVASRGPVPDLVYPDRTAGTALA